MAVVIEGRATVRGSESAEGVGDHPGPPKARTLTPDSECPGNCFGELAYTGHADLYACMDCGTTYHVPIAEHEKVCRFGCGRRVMECSYHGPPCEERLRIHRVHFGTDAIERETEREDAYSQDRREYRED